MGWCVREAADGMTRCLNCGAERDEDVCAVCGLDSSDAEFSLRRSMLNRTAIFLLGAIAFITASGRYPAVDLDRILIFIGLLFFLTLAIAVWVERRAQKHREVEALKRIYFGLVPVPWLLAALLFVNGALDKSTPEVVLSMPGPVPNRRLIVMPWQSGDKYEHLSVSRFDFDQFHNGETVEIHVGPGLVGIPWVKSVARP
jgi:hypothetical protein